MSWRASAFVKQLSVSTKGHQIERGEKLILMVLADYHHDEKGYAEVGLIRLGAEALYEKRQLIRNLHSLESKGFLVVEREKSGPKNETNRYYIVGVATTPNGQNVTTPHEKNGQNVTTPSDIPGGGGSDFSMFKMSPIQDKPNENTNELNKKDMSSKLDESVGSDPKKPKGNSRKPEELDAIKWLFDYYQKKFHRDPIRYTLTDLRKTKGIIRLRERLAVHKAKGDGALKAAVADMKHAIDAIAKSEFHITNKFIEWDKHLFWSQEKLEMWLNRAGSGTGPPGQETKSASQRMKESYGD